jgi:hypothetical protein
MNGLEKMGSNKNTIIPGLGRQSENIPTYKYQDTNKS